MKKSIILTLILVLSILSLTACGSGENQGGTSEEVVKKMCIRDSLYTEETCHTRISKCGPR